MGLLNSDQFEVKNDEWLIFEILNKRQFHLKNRFLSKTKRKQ